MKFYALPISENDVNSDTEFMNKAKKLGYEWSSENFKKALNEGTFNMKGMLIKIVPERI